MTRHSLLTRFVAALSVAPLLALGACGGTGGDTADGPIEITFWHSANGPGGEAVEQLIEEFNTEHEGTISVKSSYQGSYADAQKKFSAAVQSDSTPNVIQMNDATTGFMIDSGQTVPVRQFIEDDGEFDQDSIPQVAIDYYSDDEGLAAMPFGVSQPMMYISNELAAKAGLDVTAPPQTLDEVAEWATAIHEATGAYGFSMTMSDSWMLEMLSANGGVVLGDPDNGRGGERVTSVTLTDDVQIKAFETIADMFASGVGLNPSSSDVLNQSFAANEVGIMFASTGVYTTTQPGGSAENVTVAPLPKTSDSEDAGTPIGGNALWIVGAGHDEAEQKASYELLKFLQTPHAQAVYDVATGFLAVNEAAKDTDELGAVLTDPNIVAMYEQFESNPSSTASLGMRTGAYSSIRSTVIQAFTAAINGQDMTEAMQGAEEQVAIDLDNYNKAAER